MLTTDALKQFGADVDDGLSRCMGNEAFSFKLIGLEQEKAYFVSPAFNGSSVARDEVGKLVQKCFTAKADNVDNMIKDAFGDAVAECKYQAG